MREVVEKAAMFSIGDLQVDEDVLTKRIEWQPPPL